MSQATSAPERKLAAIMFTDIAGYTALSADNEEKALKLLDKQREILQPVVKQFDGKWLKEIGDGLLLSFSSSKNAVFCAIEIQKITREIDDLNLRIGIHQGDILAKDGDVFGDDVNIAARLEPFAAVGGIVISDKVQRDILGTPEIVTKYVGKPKLKGVKQELSVYCLISHDLPETDLSKVTAKLEEEVQKLWFNQKIIVAAILVLFVAVGGLYTIINQDMEVPSIGILLMENRGASDDDFWSSGITEDLIIKVASAGLIRVTPMKTILGINPEQEFEQIANELKVKYLVVSSLHKLKDSFELRCQIIEAKTGVSVYANKWNESFDNSPKIVGNIADNILKILNVSTKQEITKVQSAIPQAYEFYLNGKYRYEKRQDAKDIEIARGLFSKAVDLDSNLVEALIYLGTTYKSLNDQSKAKEYFELGLVRANQTNSKVSKALSLRALGGIEYGNGNLDNSYSLTNEALILAQEVDDKFSEAEALGRIAWIHHFRGEFNKALQMYEQAHLITLQIGEKSDIASSWLTHGTFLGTTGDIDGALEEYYKALEIQQALGLKADEVQTLRHIALNLSRQGDQTTALKIFEQTLIKSRELGDVSGENSSLTRIGLTYFDMGEYQKAIEYYDEAIELNIQKDFKLFYYWLLLDKAHAMLRAGHNIADVLDLLHTAEEGLVSVQYWRKSIFWDIVQVYDELLQVEGVNQDELLLSRFKFVELAYGALLEELNNETDEKRKEYLSSVVERNVKIIEAWESIKG